MRKISEKANHMMCKLPWHCQFYDDKFDRKKKQFTSHCISQHRGKTNEEVGEGAAKAGEHTQMSMTEQQKHRVIMKK